MFVAIKINLVHLVDYRSETTTFVRPFLLYTYS